MGSINLASVQTNCKYIECPELNPTRKYPTDKLFADAVKNRNFALLDDVVIVASIPNIDNSLIRFNQEKVARDFVFSDDIWSNDYCKSTINETVRTPNFTHIKNSELKIEAKIVCACMLWVVGKQAKLSSLLRKCENIIFVYRILEKQGYRSIFWLDRESVRNAVLAELFINKKTGKKKSNRTVKNYLMDLSDICLIGRTKLGEYGYYLKTNLQSFSPDEDDANQTYCTPFRILMNMWSDMMAYFTAHLDTYNHEEFVRLMDIYRGFNDSEWYNTGKKSSHYRLNYYYNTQQESLKDLYDNGSTFIQQFISYGTYHRWKKKHYSIDSNVLTHFHLEVTQETSNIIQAMTGMRQHEMKGVYHDSLILEDKHVGIKSYFQKFADEGGQVEDWAAASFVETAFKALVRINTAILGKTEEEIADVPLSFNMRRWGKTGVIDPMMFQRQSEWARYFTNNDRYILTDEDLHEFKLLNPNINNHEKLSQEIYVGAIWPLRSHQYRRSIAVHAKRLNLVTNNTVAVQYKHLNTTQTEWYMSGWDNNNTIRHEIPLAFAKELEKAELELSASLAMRFQNGTNLIGEGGKQLMGQKESNDSHKLFPTFKKAMSMAKRGGTKVVSLGNGFYCMNGNECEFKPVVQSSSCNPECPSMVSDKESIPVWKKRYYHYKELLELAIKDSKSQSNIDFLELEMNFYKDALDFYGALEIA